MNKNRFVSKCWGWLGGLPVLLLFVYSLYFIMSKGSLDIDNLLDYFNNNFIVFNNGAFNSIKNLIVNFIDNFVNTSSSVYLMFVINFGVWCSCVCFVRLLFDLIMCIPNMIINYFERKVN